MKQIAQRILSAFLAILTLTVMVFPASAVPSGSPLYDTVDFYNFVYGVYQGWRKGHPDIDDSQYPGFRPGLFGADGNFAGGSFGGGTGREDYDTYVSTLPADNINSQGLSSFYITGWTYEPSSGYDDTKILESKSEYPYAVISRSGSTSAGVEIKSSAFTVPVSGNYKIVFPKFVAHESFVSSTSGCHFNLAWPATSVEDVTDLEKLGYGYQGISKIVSLAAGMPYSIWSNGIKTVSASKGGTSYFSCNRPYIEGVSVYDVGSSGDTYNTNSRPTSITGGNYGIVGDNGQITKVEDNSTIVNETNNTFYNPATGQTQPITNWSYDYSDRSYKVTTESGDTVAITYGDENITIKEGDTVYNIYYLVDGSGSETPVDPPASCEHTWAETGSTAPTCTLSGSKLMTCSKCQQTQKETIRAVGHDWQVKQSVTTEFDESGQLTQQGYTIFECFRCHEQYKSTDGTAPPGGGSGTDPGGEEDGTTIGGLIEKLLSGVGSIVGGIIKGLLSLLTKAVEALAGLADLFTTFVSSLVDLWGGFTGFLSSVFPFLPDEFIVIIELGVILMIAAAVFKKFLS